jgi:hypothetical protein
MMPDEERRRHLIAVRLADEEYLPLQRIADRKNLPVSRFVREGVRLVIEKYSKKR